MKTIRMGRKYLKNFFTSLAHDLLGVASLIIFTIISCGIGHTQTLNSFSSINQSVLSDQTSVLPLSGTNFETMRLWSDAQLTILLGALNEVPTIPASSLPNVGTFWSLQFMAPLPCDTAGVDASGRCKSQCDADSPQTV